MVVVSHSRVAAHVAPDAATDLSPDVAPPGDRIGELVEYWRRENPDLDVTVKTLSMRLRSVVNLLDKAMRRELAALDIERWEMEMLLALRRAPGHQSSAGALCREAQVTSGAITNRLGRLEGRGWIRRDVDQSDRRQVLVTLTPAGGERAGQLVSMKNEAEQRFFGGMPRAVLERMTGDLRDLLGSIPEDIADPPAQAWPKTRA